MPHWKSGLVVRGLLVGEGVGLGTDWATAGRWLRPKISGATHNRGPVVLAFLVIVIKDLTETT